MNEVPLFSKENISSDLDELFNIKVIFHSKINKWNFQNYFYFFQRLDIYILIIEHSCRFLSIRINAINFFWFLSIPVNQIPMIFYLHCIVHYYLVTSNFLDKLLGRNFRDILKSTSFAGPKIHCWPLSKWFHDFFKISR